MADPRDAIFSGILETPTVWLQVDTGGIEQIDQPFSGAESRLGRLDGQVDSSPSSELPGLPLTSRLRLAFENRAFSVAYQPCIDARTGLIRGVEALLRWTDPQHEANSPTDFVPDLERTGLIVPVGDWLLQEACRRIGPMRSADEPLGLSANLSPRQFTEPGLVDRIAGILDRCGFAPQRLEVEITESMIENLEHARATIEELRALGVRVLIDDFGIGYSSLNHLKLLPVAGLKLDRTFIAGMLTDRHDRLITESIIRLARELCLDVVAEGVEDRKHASWLRARGVKRLQGFLYSPGVRWEELEAMLLAQPFARRPAAPAAGRSRSARRSPRRGAGSV